MMRKSRLSWPVQGRLIEHFVAGTTARTAASLVGVNKTTAAFYFHRLREIVAQQSEDASPVFGEIEVDESYFDGLRKGKRGRGAAGKVPVWPAKTRRQGLCQGRPGREGPPPHQPLRAIRRPEEHSNGIENFWNQAKRHMRRFNGVPVSHFHLFLKECEWRFNNPSPKQQKTQLIQWATNKLK